MAGEFDTRVIEDFTRDIAGRLSEAALLARTADEFSKQGLAERAFSSLLEIEPLLHDASTLLNATSVVRRRERPIDPD